MPSTQVPDPRAQLLRIADALDDATRHLGQALDVADAAQMYPWAERLAPAWAAAMGVHYAVQDALSKLAPRS